MLLALLGALAEKDIADELRMNRGTLHNYVIALYARFGADSAVARLRLLPSPC